MNYYNEHEPYAIEWLCNLIEAGHIPRGYVDDRDIRDVVPSDLKGFTQCHFFAGIGIWSLALRGAGWAEDRPVWSGSCPCQPFSAAGKGAGFADERHLWPAWHHLIAQAKPGGVPVLGEQVASPDGLAWLDLVQADMEGAGATFRPVDLCAAGVGAPHIRQRLFWVADAEDFGRAARGRSGAGVLAPLEPERHRDDRGPLADDGRDGFVQAHGRVAGAKGRSRPQAGHDADGCREPRIVLADAHGGRLAGSGGRSLHSGGQPAPDADVPFRRGVIVFGMGDTTSGGFAVQRGAAVAGQVRHADGAKRAGLSTVDRDTERLDDSDGARLPIGEPGPEETRDCGTRAIEAGPTNGYWADAEWVWCRDGKARPVEPGLEPLAYGVAARVGKLRAYGNALVAPAAEAFIRSVM